MDHWMFTCTRSREYRIPSRTIFETRMKDRFWGLGERTPNRKSVRRGDRVVFYVGLPDVCFAGTAMLGSDVYQLSPEQKKRIGHDSPFWSAPFGVDLTEVDVWQEHRSARLLVPSLRFIDNKAAWPSYFQGGIKQLPEDDFATITGASSTLTVGRLSAALEDIEAESEFALESHLEEFMAENWPQIGFGAQLALYSDGENEGRQFPAGPWNIDFLCVDRTTNDLVVIELKKGRSSDATVGQILRYMAWVKEKIAEPGQNVRGIIIVRKIDEALKYAVAGLPSSLGIRVLTYKVNFSLS